MTLANDYKRQFGWRAWPSILDALPLVRGQTVLDLGCGVGDLSAELVARGARVIGVDMNDALLSAAQSRSLAGAEFRRADLNALGDLGVTADGLWCSFTAAYFPDLTAALASWTKQLRPRGWIALTEIDDLFGHEPLSAATKSLFEAYARDALHAKRYDFHMGRKLSDGACGQGGGPSGEQSPFTIESWWRSAGGLWGGRRLPKPWDIRFPEHPLRLHYRPLGSLATRNGGFGSAEGSPVQAVLTVHDLPLPRRPLTMDGRRRNEHVSFLGR